jgi:hypothetical protein
MYLAKILASWCLIIKAAEASNGELVSGCSASVQCPIIQASASSSCVRINNFDDHNFAGNNIYCNTESTDVYSTVHIDNKQRYELRSQEGGQWNLVRVTKTKAKHTTKKNEGRHIEKLRKTLLGCNTKQQQQQQRSTKGSPFPYVEANTKISRVLKHVKLKSKKEDMQASRLNDFYRLVQRETAAAIVLQSHCRRVLATVQVRQFANETAQAIKIQCCTRQFIARNVLGELQRAKLKATLIRERVVRLYVARCLRRNQIKLEYNAAVTCQSAVRMYFAKHILRSKKLQHSWEVNQMRWQLISLRLAFADVQFIKSLRAIQIQCVVRRRLAQTRVASKQSLYTKAAIRIQCCWRRYEAKKRNIQIRYERAVEQQCNKVRIIMSEHNYWKEKATSMQTEPKLQLKSDLEMQRANLIEAQQQKQEEICALETHFEDQANLLQEITPQEIEGGWEEQVKINLVDTRERI